MSQRNIKSTSYPLASYARAHDYDNPTNPSQKPKWSARWVHETLQVTLDEVSSPTSGGATMIRLRVFQSASAAHHFSQAFQEEVHVCLSNCDSNSASLTPNIQEDIDLTKFQNVLHDSPTRNLVEQHGLPLRAAYRGNQLLFRYPSSFSMSHKEPPVSLR